MNIVVCLKQVPDTETKIQLKDDGSGIVEEGIKYVVNPYDEYAVEEAIQLKEKFDAVLVHNIFSFGGNLPAAIAINRWIRTFHLPALAIHHDFYWERQRYAHIP